LIVIFGLEVNFYFSEDFSLWGLRPQTPAKGLDPFENHIGRVYFMSSF